MGSGQSKQDKGIESTPGPSGLGCSNTEVTRNIVGESMNVIHMHNPVINVNNLYLDKHADPRSNQLIDSFPTRLENEVLNLNRRELRATSDNTVTEPTPGPSGLGYINSEMVDNNVARDPLIYGFPTRLIDEKCVGREADVEELLKLAKTNYHVLVRGRGGMGKTSLAMKCALLWTEAGEFQEAAFLLMENEEAFKSSFIGLATKCNLHLDNNILPQLPSFYDKLNKSKILLIFDNINDGMDIQPYLPNKTHHSNIHILGTSQYEIPQLFYGYKLVDLPEWAAVELLIAILEPPVDIPEDLLRKLVQRMDCLASAVRQAACAICQDVVETRKDIVEAIESYIKESDTKLDEKLDEEYSNYYKKTVYAALHYNIRRCVNDDDLGKKLLHVISFLQSPMHTIMFKKVPRITREVLNKLIYRFVRYSLVTEDRRQLTMHRTTQAVIRHAYAEAEGDVLPCVFHMLNTSYPWITTFHLPYVTSKMNESMLTKGCLKLIILDSYNKEREKLEKYGERLMLEWEAPQFAAYLGHKEVLDTLRQRQYLDTWITKSGWSWIHAAALGDRGYLLSEYMTDSSSIDRRITRTGHTALHVAVRADSRRFITELIKWGANLNIRDVDRDSALYIALSLGHLEIALELLKTSSEINPELCSEITATYSITRELEFPSSITGRRHLLKVDIQYFYIIAYVEVEGRTQRRLSRLSKFIDSPCNTQLLKKIQNELDKEFVCMLEAVDGIWEAAVVASGYMRQHQLTVCQLVDEISREEQIPGVSVLYPPRARCTRALAFIKLFINKIKNTSPNAFDVLTLLAALPRSVTVNDVFDYYRLNSWQIYEIIHILEGNRILRKIKKNLKEEIRALTHTFITTEKLPPDNCILFFTIRLSINEKFDKNFACLALDQMSLNQLTVACKRATHLDPHHRWVRMLERLKEAGCKSIDSSKDVTWSALHFAIVFLNMDFNNFQEHVIERLLELGVEVDVRGPGDVTPLHIAALCDRSLKTTRVLLNKRAQVNAVTLEGFTPLHMAVYSGSKTITILLGAGGQVNAVTDEGLTPLHLATSCHSLNSHKTITVLLKAGGQVNAVTHEGLTPLHMAASNNPSTITILLEAGGQVNAVTDEGLTPLHTAASSHSWYAHKIIPVLLEAGGQVNGVTHEGFTPLHMAASSHSCNARGTIPVLLEAGGQVNAMTHEGATPLHMVASSHSWVIHQSINVLLEAVGEVNAVTHKGLTPLHMAVSCNSWYAQKTIAALLKAGGQVNAVSHEGRTPLHMAASCDLRYAHKTIAMLLEAGGQANAVTPEGLTPLHMAASSDSWYAHKTIAMLLEAGGQVNAVTQEGLTPLHRAASSDSWYAHKIIAMLLEAGGQMNAVTHEGLTPLHMAASHGSRYAHKTIAVLLGAKGQVNAVTHEGLTPLQMVPTNRRFRIIRELLKVGADTQSQDKKRWVGHNKCAAYPKSRKIIDPYSRF